MPTSHKPCHITEKTDTQGKTYYEYDKSSSSNLVKSDANGIIDIRNLPLNSYYLIERPLTGYNVNTTAKIQFTVDVNNANEVQKYNTTIENTEKTSSITLTKKDSNSGALLPNASYYLLREIPDGVNFTPDFEFNNKKWKIQGSYKTDTNGKITVSGLNFGTYLFYEVQAPVGYEIIDNEKVTPIEITAENAGTPFSPVHEDPRKTAHVKILKTDENGEPLNGAKYNLYKTDTEAEDKLIETYTTDYDGMNTQAIEIKGEDWGEYYFEEVTPPVGYNISTEPNKKVPFTIDANTADQTLYIVRANDSRKLGRVTLIKKAAGSIGTIKAGDLLNDAEFKLYKSNDQEVLVSWVDAENCYKVDQNGTDLIITGKCKTGATDEEIANAGKFTIIGLEWGDYYLKEITAPANFKLDESKISFTVGRNNTDGQELVFENEPALAKVTIIKEITERVEEWGNPTFVFNIVKTDTPNQNTEKTVCIEVENGTTAQQMIELEPGTYQISELPVSRYKLDSMKIGDTDITSAKQFTINANGDITITCKNSIEYYDKASYTNAEVNEFNGIKGIKVTYPDIINFTSDVTEIIKTTESFKAYRIMSNGQEEQITGDELKNLKISYEKGSNDDENFKVTDYDNTFTVTSKKEYVHNSVYTLKATYQGFSCNFDIRFAQTPIDANKKEVTLLFTTDDENRCYFKNAKNETFSTYSLIYMITGQNVKILQSDQVIPEIGEIAFNDDTVKIKNTELFTVQVNDAFSNKYELDEWEYKLDESDEWIAGIPNLDTIKTANNTITVKIQTKSKGVTTP